MYSVQLRVEFSKTTFAQKRSAHIHNTYLMIKIWFSGGREFSLCLSSKLCSLFSRCSSIILTYQLSFFLLNLFSPNICDPLNCCSRNKKILSFSNHTRIIIFFNSQSCANNYLVLVALEPDFPFLIADYRLYIAANFFFIHGVLMHIAHLLFSHQYIFLVNKERLLILLMFVLLFKSFFFWGMGKGNFVRENSTYL